jgi:hypothetical protein
MTECEVWKPSMTKRPESLDAGFSAGSEGEEEGWGG